MTRPFKVAVVFGTRPEAIKLAPIVAGFKSTPAFACQVCVTAQHRQMLDQVLHVFGIVPDADLSLMESHQTLAGFAAKALTAVDSWLSCHPPNLLIVQGDTTTTFCASLAAYYQRIPIAHVEAGLRTGRKDSPFPEEVNRVLTTHLADIHFAPTDQARLNLLREGIPDAQINVTGNTVVDALRTVVELVRRAPPSIPELPEDLQPRRPGREIVLITGHRRESFGEGFRRICEAIAKLAYRRPQTAFVYPVHLNPNVRKPVFGLLGDLPNVYLIAPLEYYSFVALMDRCRLILTDSGGIQEEAPSLEKPVLIMRETTERTEAVDLGMAKLVGTDVIGIVESADAFLSQGLRAPVAEPYNPYGDGRAAERIIAYCEHWLMKREVGS